MQSMLSAFFAEFFEFHFFFDLLLVASGMIIHGLADIAFELDDIFLRHNSKFKI